MQDDEAELLAELERIKKERAEEAAKKRKEEQAEKEAQLREEVSRGNPLLNQPASFQVRSFSLGSAFCIHRIMFLRVQVAVLRIPWVSEAGFCKRISALLW